MSEPAYPTVNGRVLFSDFLEATDRIKTENKKMERGYYVPIKSWLEGFLDKKFASLYLEVTADRTFSNTLKAQSERNRDLIFSFFREAAADLPGFVKKDSTSSREFVAVEVKAQTIRLDDIYQTRKYAELFDARYALFNIAIRDSRGDQEIVASGISIYPRPPCL